MPSKVKTKTYFEKPDVRELKILFVKYGKPRIRKMKIDLSDLYEKKEYPPCKGEGFIIIHKKNKILMVKTKNKQINGWSFPKGRIMVSESIEDGTIREAREETGLEISLKKLIEIQKRLYVFKNIKIERWYFIFIAEIIGGKMAPIDNNEISNVKFVKNLPKEWKNEKWIHQILINTCII